MPLVRTDDRYGAYRYTGLDKRRLPKLFGADGPLLWDIQFVQFLKQFPEVWRYFCDVQWREASGELLLAKREAKKVRFDADLKPVVEARDLLLQAIPWPWEPEASRKALEDAHATFCTVWEAFRTLAGTKKKEWESLYIHFAHNFRIPQLDDKDCFLRYTNGDGSFRLIMVWGVK